MVANKDMKVRFRDVIGFMSRHYRRHSKKVLGAYLAIVLTSALDVSYPFAFEWFVDTVTAVGEHSPRDFKMIFWPLVVIVSNSLLFFILLRTAHILNCYTDSAVQAEVALEAVGKVHTFETDWHSNSFVGSIVTAVRRGRWAAHNFYDLICYEFWPAFLVTLTSIFLMFLKSPVIAVFFLLYSIGFVIFGLVINRHYVQPSNRAAAAEDSRLGGIVADSITGHSTVKSFGRESDEQKRLGVALKRWQEIARRAWIRDNILSLAQSFLVCIGRILAVTYAGWLWAQGQFTGGEVVYVLMSQRVVSTYLDSIGNRMNAMTVAVNDLEEVVSWQLRKPAIVTTAETGKHDISQGLVEFKNVTFGYSQQASNALSDFTLTIYPGEKIALVGPSGGGKSTVLKLLQRLYEPQNGVIAVDNHLLSDFDLRVLRAGMALVPQDPILFHRSLAENIAYARPEASMEEIISAARAAQIDTLINSLPEKYDTLVGERGIKLSGGERQRVAIARAILANTPILLLDEATSALDSECEEEIQAAIAHASQGRTMIAIAHRLSTIQSADRIIVLSRGRIIEQGTHTELLKIPDGLYRRLYESQAKGFLLDHLP